MPPQKKFLFTNLKCDVCRKEFESKPLLQSHKKIHTDEYKFSCSQCDFRCKVKKYLHRHEKAKHLDRRDNECDVCGKRFLYPSKLAAHKLVHTGEKPYRCNECDKAFNTTYSLNTHKFIHTGEKPFKCTHCAYSCRDSSTLRKHEQRHVGAVRLYRCVACALTLRSKASLKNHVAEKHLNLDIRKYFCDTCKKGFKSKTTLSVHVRTVHLRTKQCKCPVCGVTISNYSNLSQHMVSHSARTPYECECGKRFKNKSDLTKHKIIHTPEKHMTCEICDRKFSRKHRLERHIMVKHARKPKEKCVECAHCGDRFTNPFQLLKHKRSEHLGRRPPRRAFHCDLCGFQTGLKSCIVMHLKYGHAENKYTKHCNECRHKFRTEFSYKMHMATEHGIVVGKDKNGGKGEDFGGKNDDRVKVDELKDDLPIKEELEYDQDSVPIDLFEVEKEEVLEDHLPKEIQATIQNAIQSDFYGQDPNIEKYDDSKINKKDDNSIQRNEEENDNYTNSIQNVKDTDISLAISIQCDAGDVPIQNSKENDQKLLDMENHTISIQKCDKNLTKIDNRDINNGKLNSSRTDSIQNGDNKTNKEPNTKPYKQIEKDHTTSIQNNINTIDLTQNEEIDNEIINIDKTNYVEVMKQLIIENKNELKKISEEVFDEFFIDRIVMDSKELLKKKKKEAKKSQKNVNTELKEIVKKEIKQKVVEARRQHIAKALEKTRRIYNDRLNRALDIVNPKEKIKVKYFNKNQVQLVELESPQNTNSRNKNSNSDQTIEKSNLLRKSSRRSSSTSSKRSLNNETLLLQKGDDIPLSVKSKKRCKRSSLQENSITQRGSIQPLAKKRKLSKDNPDSSENIEETRLSDEKTSYSEENNDESLLRKRRKVSTDDDNSLENNEETSQSEESDSICEVNDKKKYINKCKLKMNIHQCYVCFKLYNTKEKLLDHCKDHFEVTTAICLKKCPLCGHVTKLSLGTHMRRKHGLCVKLPYGKLHNQNENERISKYYYKMNESDRTGFDKIEVIPSVKCLNNIASRELEKRERDMKNKTVTKTKLVKKGEEWIVEKEKIDFDKTFLLPAFDAKDVEIDEKNVKINAEFKIVFNYIDNLKILYKIAKKKGQKIMFPCKDCDKVCQTLAALKLHIRNHDPNKKPFKKKVWKHKLKDNATSKKIKSKEIGNKRNNKKGYNNNSKRNRENNIKEDLVEDLLEMSLKDRLKRNKLLNNKTVNNKISNSNRNYNNRDNSKTNSNVKYSSKEVYKKAEDEENRERNPRPVKNKHRCDPQLIEFYKHNVKGGDIEFWQFLKIFNKMTRENIEEFSDLKKRTEFGLDFDVGEEININTDEICSVNKDSNNDNSQVTAERNIINNNSKSNNNTSADESTNKEVSIRDDNNKEAINVVNNTNNNKNNDKPHNNINNVIETTEEINSTINAKTVNVVLEKTINNLKPKILNRMVSINESVFNNFDNKNSSVLKKRISKLSKGEIKRREAKKRLLREKFAKEIV